MEANLLSEFLNLANRIWLDYQRLGPGMQDGHDYKLLEAAKHRLVAEIELDDSSSEQILDAVLTLKDLADRCVNRTEGLCFVSGEAGLIPRREMHDRFEQALAYLAEQVGDR